MLYEVITALLYFLVKKANRLISLWDGVLMGLGVAVAWYITGVLGAESIERIVDLEALSYVFPTGKTLEFFMNYQAYDLSFSVCFVITSYSIHYTKLYELEPMKAKEIL